MAANELPAKRDIFLGLLAQGRVSVIIDARRDGVQLPDHLRDELRLRLDYGLDMPIPIEDLQVTDSGVQATLSFNRQPHTTFVPWSAVYVVAQADGAGVLYPDDVPAELTESFAPAQPSGPDDAPAPTVASAEDTERTDVHASPQAADSPARAPRLSLVPEEDGAQAPDPSAGDDGPEPAGPPKRKPAKRPTLRLVK